MHQTFLCPPHSTLLAAINNHQLKGCPFMTADNVRKYLTMSPATSKVRMKRPRTGIQSTRDKAHKYHCAPLGHTAPSINETIPSTIPYEYRSSDGRVNNIFCLASLAKSRTGTFYTDATGALPAISLDGNQYYFIAYDYDTTYIFAIPIKNVTDDAIMKDFKEVFWKRKDKGHKPTFIVTDNQATKPIKTFLNT